MKLRDAWKLDVGPQHFIYDPEIVLRAAIEQEIARLRARDCRRRRAMSRRKLRYVHRPGWGGRRAGAGRPRQS